MRLLAHNAIAIAGGLAVGAAISEGKITQISILAFIIVTAGLRLIVGFADPETRPSTRQGRQA